VCTGGNASEQEIRSSMGIADRTPLATKVA
jgi:hypothetical protein